MLAALKPRLFIFQPNTDNESSTGVWLTRAHVFRYVVMVTINMGALRVRIMASTNDY